MITPYYGEFLLTTIPLELSLNWCTHACVYCFANLNQPNRTAAPQSIVNLLAQFQDRTTLEAKLLQMRYPVLLSNKVDPFSNSNWRLTLQILEILAALKIPVAFQTKGGRGIPEALDLIGPSCFYVSITCQNDEIAKHIEPGAPNITERLKLCEYLRSRGHHVWVGANPMTRQWVPDVRAFAAMLAGAGIKHVWSEVLHLSRDQIADMSPRDREAVGEETLVECLKKGTSRETFAHQMDFIEVCEANGIEFACKHWPGKTSAMLPYARCYPKRFPTMTEWADEQYRTAEVGKRITFDDFCHWFLPKLPDLRGKELFHYIGSCSRKLAREVTLPDNPSFKDILRVIWDRRDHSMNPRRSFGFKCVMATEKEPVRDAFGLPIIHFTGLRLERR